MTYQPAPGGMPLLNPTATLVTVTRIKGEACKELNIRVYLGVDEVEPEAGTEPGLLQYRCEFNHRQTTIRVEWSARD